MIIEEISKNYPDSNVEIVSFKPNPSWPDGRFIWSGYRCVTTRMPAYINIVGVKRLNFSISLLLILNKIKPSILIKYNISILESIAILLYKLFNPKAYLAAIIQDVHYASKSKNAIRNSLEAMAMRMVSRFNMLVPVSRNIAVDFKYSLKKTVVFQGGITRQGQNLLFAPNCKLEPYAIFAGALEPYNGIDRLVKQWSAANINIDLHVFGKGSSESLVREASSHNSRIIFHGFETEEYITRMQCKSLINFCLRYSDGIEQGYFFPSKLFNICCAPGVVMSNDFEGLPSELKNYLFLLEDDLSDLSEKINMVSRYPKLVTMRNKRINWIKKHGDWSVIVRNIIDHALIK